jgi:hypothetical protein
MGLIRPMQIPLPTSSSVSIMTNCIDVDTHITRWTIPYLLKSCLTIDDRIRVDLCSRFQDTINTVRFAWENIFEHFLPNKE